MTVDDTPDEKIKATGASFHGETLGDDNGSRIEIESQTFHDNKAYEQSDAEISSDNDANQDADTVIEIDIESNPDPYGAGKTERQKPGLRKKRQMQQGSNWNGCKCCLFLFFIVLFFLWLALYIAYMQGRLDRVVKFVRRYFNI